MKIHPFPIFNGDCYPWATTTLWLHKLSSVVNMESKKEKKVDAVSCQPWKWHQKLWSWKTFPQSDRWVWRSRSFMFSLNILTSSGFTDALYTDVLSSCAALDMLLPVYNYIQIRKTLKNATVDAAKWLISMVYLFSSFKHVSGTFTVPHFLSTHLWTFYRAPPFLFKLCPLMFQLFLPACKFYDDSVKRNIATFFSLRGCLLCVHTFII